jgi:hypothetical protein
MMNVIFVAVVASLVLAGSLQADLNRALAEPNLEKRSGLAIENALAAYKNARTAYETGDNEKVVASLAEVEESVTLAHKSLNATGKDPRKSPKWFKKAEIETRDLLRKLESFQHQMGFEDRPLVDKAKAAITRVHDDLLVGLMQGKKKK